MFRLDGRRRRRISPVRVQEPPYPALRSARDLRGAALITIVHRAGLAHEEIARRVVEMGTPAGSSNGRAERNRTRRRRIATGWAVPRRPRAR